MSISVAPKVNLGAVSQSILPGQTCAFDIGGSGLQFRDLWLNGVIRQAGGGIGPQWEGELQPTLDATWSIGDLTHRWKNVVISGDVIGSAGSPLYIKRSPSGENQTILPLTDNVPLTIQAFSSTATSDLLDLSNPAAPLNPVFGVGPSGATKILVSTDKVPLTLQGSIAAVSHLLDVNVAGGILVVTVGPTGAVKITPSADVVSLAVLKGIPAGVSDIFDVDTAGGIPLLSVGPTGGTTIKPSANVVPLTITGQAPLSQTVNLLNVANAAPGVNVFTIGPTGATTILPDFNVVPLTLQEPSGGTVDILDLKDGGGTLQVFVDSVGNLATLQRFGVGVAVSANDLVTLKDTRSFTVSSFLIDLQAGAAFGAGSITYTYLGSSAAALDLAGQASPTILGLSFIPLIHNSGAATTVTKIASILSQVQWASLLGSTNTVTELDMVQAGPASGLNANWPTVTTYRALFVPTQGNTAVPPGTILGLDIATLLGTTVIGIREQSGGTNRLLGDTRIGDVSTAPVQLLELRGSLPSLVLDGSEASGVRRRIRENTGGVEITDDTPTVLRNVVTRGAANVAVAHNATSVTVTFSTAEPDTSYEITAIPAYNSGSPFYTSKSATGFTVNFPTAGPVGGSTFDWHIERIPRT